MQKPTLEGFRLSPQQKHLWSLQPNSFAYRAQCAILLEGKLQVEILKEAVQQVVNRHEILRTKFHFRSGIVIPMQVICDRGNPDWQTFNLSDVTPQQQQTKIEELFQQERSLTINWERNSLLRLSLLIFSPQQHILLITLPSQCADSWTLKNLVKEIAHTYEKCLNNEQLSDEPVQYIQFSEWQNELLEEEDAENGKTYWQEQLDLLTAITLPFEKQPSDTRFDPNVWSLTIDPAVIAKLEYTANLYQTTIREFLLTCWQILLWRITGSEFAIETIFSGRTYEELHETLGLLAKWLPVCYRVQSNFKFQEILSGISQTLQNHNQWQEYFVWKKNTASNNRIAFEFEDWSDKYDAGGTSFSVERQYVCFERFKVKLSCIRQAESLTAKFYYDPEIIDPESIQYWGELFQTLVANAVNNPEARVSELEILSDRERQRILFEFNQTQTAYPLDKCIHQLFTEQAAKTPHKIAVVFEDQQLTYAQLNTRANKIAHYLQNLGVKPEVLVGIYLERSLLLIISILAILKAGGAYLPLDPALPSSAVTLRLQDAEAKVLLTEQQLINNFPELATKIVCLDAQEIIAHESEENPHCEVKNENLVYTIYTSGSTGKPKGVAIEHRQLLNYFYSIRSRLNLTPGSSFALVSTLAADLGNTVIFPSLCSGGCLHIISSERIAEPQAVADYFDRHPIDCLKIVPSHLKALLTTEEPGKILPRQQLILGGETTNWDLIDRVRQIAPECKILNHYGPTEATIGVTTFEVEKAAKSNKSAKVPIGRALANTQIYLLDSKKQPVPIGVAGELHIGGAPLAREYLNQPELTAQKFITNPFVEGERIYNTGDKARYLPDGNIEFLGRTDNQVKIRGFRIELGEIEAVLSQNPEVEQVVVAVSEDESGNRKLIAYVVPRSQTFSTSDLRIFSLSQLPEYATPSTFILLKTLPLTPNGKIDRQALPAPDSTRPEIEAVYVAPRTSIEEKLVEIWQELLGLEKIGIQDNFFELGGHSLLITQLLARVRDTFKVEISLHSLFKLPTIVNIAQKIQGTKPSTKDIPIDLKAEAVLDPTIRPNGLIYKPNKPPSAILLTGATGFLGAFLLYELLQQTQADIYCLVRSSNIESGKKKLQSSLESYLLWNESFSTRIIPIIGNLSEPLLGLSESEFQLLATQLDVIYHNGALVNFTYPYQALKKPNVLGTQEIIKLAGQAKLKPVHFISTTSFVYPSDSEISIVREQDSIDDVLMPTDGYAQSKWVAEKLITIARDRGLPISIYRPGRISGHSKTGACNSNDHTYRIIKGCIQLGSMPNLDLQMNLSPCDYVSQAIVYLSKQSASLGKTFHLRNPQPLTLKEIAKYLCSLGYPVELVSYDKWRAQLINHPDASANALYPLFSTFVEQENVSPSNRNSNRQAAPPVQKYDCQNTSTGLADSAIVCPPVDAELFGIYISYLRQTSVLNPPLPPINNAQLL